MKNAYALLCAGSSTNFNFGVLRDVEGGGASVSQFDIRAAVGAAGQSALAARSGAAGAGASAVPRSDPDNCPARRRNPPEVLVNLVEVLGGSVAPRSAQWRCIRAVAAPELTGVMLRSDPDQCPVRRRSSREVPANLVEILGGSVAPRSVQ